MAGYFETISINNLYIWKSNVIVKGLNASSNYFQMTSIVLPNMVEKGGGVIINVGSASGDITCPLLTAYSACKVGKLFCI